MATGPDLTRQQREVAQHHARLLRRIQHLAHEHTRISTLGFGGYDGTDADASREWATHLEWLTAEREVVEQQALEAGVEEAWIADMRELGLRTSHPPQLVELPTASSETQQLWFDLMTPDLWHLERMAYLVAAYRDRVDTGRATFEVTELQATNFEHTMGMYHARATALAHTAQVSAVEGELLWGTGAEAWRKLHNSYVGAQSEDGLRNELRKYMTADPGLALPPYIPVDANGQPVTRAQSVPPAPEQMIADAYAAIRTQFVQDAVAAEAPMTAAIEASVTSGVGEWGRESGTTTDVSPIPGKEAGMEP